PSTSSTPPSPPPSSPTRPSPPPKAASSPPPSTPNSTTSAPSAPPARPPSTGSSGRASIAAIEDRERRRTGIGSLKVRFNSVFGYYIEITKSNLASVPADYERKQTLVNAERFTTPELKDYETKVLTAQERSVEIEKRL